MRLGEANKEQFIKEVDACHKKLDFILLRFNSDLVDPIGIVTLTTDKEKKMQIMVLHNNKRRPL